MHKWYESIAWTASGKEMRETIGHYGLSYKENINKRKKINEKSKNQTKKKQEDNGKN